MSWCETGGPPVSPPTRKGFGSVLIQRVLKREHGNARLSYSDTGFSCEMEFML
jgi:two-component sensor histidine kinase